MANITTDLRALATRQTLEQETHNFQQKLNFAANIIDGIHGLHFPVVDADGVERCNLCGQKFTWPCPTDIILNWNME